VINKLPKNYDIENPENIIDLKARADLNYVYMLLNNKIWVFRPNTTNYQNTKSLTYIWQIEWDSKKIKEFLYKSWRRNSYFKRKIDYIKSITYGVVQGITVVFTSV